MADERLGASFSIDTTDLKAGLAQANRLIRESESEFKAAAAGMDDWTKSEDGLSAKIKSLNSITDLQHKKVDALTSQYEQLIADGLDPASKEATELRTKINNETAALNKNEKELRDQNKALGEFENQTEKSAKAVDKLSKGFGVLKAAGKVAAVAITAVSAAVGAVTKQAIDSYADYEQLVGGVDTLFGAASEEVQKKAANAYKTAGMSANEYMETVTGFSASLIQSLGGDTQKAAKYADMAISDMSDNANKMGTDIASIQNAYGGFAKQNYTMLDNLKLGYGGTKEEMQRLLDDASKLSGIEYDISSYSDIVSAIHVVQDEMGITGTTAKEASETIAGSLASAKSAYQNLLTGLADDNADIDMLVNNVIESASTALDNIIPRILTVLETLPKAISKILPKIPPLVQELLPSLLTAATSVIQGLIGILPELIKTITGMLPNILEAMLGMLPDILDAVITIVIDIIDALAAMLPQIVDAIMAIIPRLVNSLIKAIPQLQKAAITLLMAIVDAIPVIITQLIRALPSIISTVINGLINSIPMLTKGAVQLFMGIIQAIPTIIAELNKEVPNIIKAIVTGLIEGIPELIKAGGEMLAGLFKGLINPQVIWENVKKMGSSILDSVKDFFGIHSPSRVMRDEIGKNLALGIGEGFEDNIGAVNNEIKRAMNFDDVNVNVNAQRKDSGGSQTASGGVVVYQTNNYSQAHSRLELYKTKQQTAAAVRLAVAGGVMYG